MNTLPLKAVTFRYQTSCLSSFLNHGLQNVPNQKREAKTFLVQELKTTAVCVCDALTQVDQSEYFLLWRTFQISCKYIKGIVLSLMYIKMTKASKILITFAYKEEI